MTIVTGAEERCLLLTGAVARSHRLPGAWIRAARGFILDLDGTLVREHRPMAGADALLDRLAGRYVILSNNSSDTAETLARRLHRMGLNLDPGVLVLAGEVAVRQLAAARPGLRTMLIGSSHLRRLAVRSGLELTDHDPELVLLARDERFTYHKLRAAARALREGAELVATNPDGYHPGDDGRGPVPETGALLQALIACSGVRPTRIVGKPEASLFIEALRRLGTPASDTLMIGDNPNTDALGAVRQGMRFLLIGQSPRADVPDLSALLRYVGSPRSTLVDDADPFPR